MLLAKNAVEEAWRKEPYRGLPVHYNKKQELKKKIPQICDLERFAVGWQPTEAAVCRLQSRLTFILIFT